MPIRVLSTRTVTSSRSPSGTIGSAPPRSPGTCSWSAATLTRRGPTSEAGKALSLLSLVPTTSRSIPLKLADCDRRCSGSISKADGLFRVPLEGDERGHVVQFLAVPYQAETCGPVIHDRDGSVFISVQHPGEDGSWDEQLSYFPDYVPAGVEPAAGAWRGPARASFR